MTNRDEAAPMLPGLEPPAPAESALERAARRTLAAIESDGLLDERHALTCQLIMDLAATVSAGRRSGRASAVAMAAAQLREAIASLPAPPEDEGGEEDDAWTQLAQDLRDAERRMDPAGGGPSVGYPA